MVQTASNGQQMKAVSIKVEMEGNVVLIGDLIIPHVKSLNEALNDAKQFLEFSTRSGGLQFISKKSIVHIESLDDIQEADQLELEDEYSPYEVMGVTPQSDMNEIHTAYRKKSKLYHPDLYQNVDLPSEVAEYFLSMSQHINLAYAELCQIHKAYA